MQAFASTGAAQRSMEAASLMNTDRAPKPEAASSEQASRLVFVFRVYGERGAWPRGSSHGCTLTQSGPCRPRGIGIVWPRWVWLSRFSRPWLPQPAPIWRSAGVLALQNLAVLVAALCVYFVPGARAGIGANLWVVIAAR